MAHMKTKQKMLTKPVAAGFMSIFLLQQKKTDINTIH